MVTKIQYIDCSQQELRSTEVLCIFFLFIWACPLHQSTTNATSAIARVDLLLKFLLQSVMTFGWAGFHEFMNSNVVGICWSSVALEELDSFKSEPSLLNLECCFLGRGVTAPPPESFTVTFFGFKQIYKRGRALSSTDATLNVGRVPIAWEPQKAEREEIGTTVCISIYFDADVCGILPSSAANWYRMQPKILHPRESTRPFLSSNILSTKKNIRTEPWSKIGFFQLGKSA